MPTDLKRSQDAGDEHFLTFSCYGRLPYLNEDTARIVFEDTLEKLRRRHGFLLFGYVLMPEHVHLLLTEPTAQTLQNTIRVLKGETSKQLKGNREHLWQARYYDFNVYSDAKHIEKLRYMHRNPVTRGLVEKPADWPWSSFRHFQTGELGRVEVESEWTWNRRHGEGSFCPK
ncbi:MAG TPA: transposase [Acidisarcina sp.]